MSDGVQAFTGLTIAAFAGNEQMMLIDEPEAFLHPALSMKLGKKLSELMNTRNGNLIVSTHSSNFMIGCIQSGKPISILRLTYSNNNPTAKLLDSNSVSDLFKHPLMRSAGVLQSVFYNSVIVGEAESDRAFYNEINERLILRNDSRAIDNGYFINGHGHQTIWEIVRPLRKMGISAVAVIDLDVIRQGGSEFTKLMNASGIPANLHNSFSQLRTESVKILDSTGKDWKREGGLSLVSGANLP